MFAVGLRHAVGETEEMTLLDDGPAHLADEVLVLLLGHREDGARRHSNRGYRVVQPTGAVCNAGSQPNGA